MTMTHSDKAIQHQSGIWPCGLEFWGHYPVAKKKTVELVNLAQQARKTLGAAGTALLLILQERRCTSDTTELRVEPGNSTRLTETSTQTAALDWIDVSLLS